jgi:SAM-dependent methyltransferase
MNKAEWYVDWFNSPYYHLLYNNRNYDEANFFINNLCAKLDLKHGANIWDLACGKGRHSIALNKKGFDVIGTDLAANSINEAKLNENEALHFFVHDMRCPFKQQVFDAVFNLFTSIGYFGNRDDNFSVFKNVADALKPNGVFVVDFFNSQKVVASFKSCYYEKRGLVNFDIQKKIENNAISKRIEFEIENKKYFFEESVSLLTKADFELFANACGLHIQETFGNYKLDTFDPTHSERLILIFKK